MNHEHRCPRCSSNLQKKPLPMSGVSQFCPSCHGCLVSLAVVRQYGDGSVVTRLWAEALANPRRGVACPSCRKPMHEVLLANIELDLCKSCQALWFDRDEFTHLPARKAVIKHPSKTGVSGSPPPATTEGAGTTLLDGVREIIEGLIDALP